MSDERRYGVKYRGQEGTGQEAYTLHHAWVSRGMNGFGYVWLLYMGMIDNLLEKKQHGDLKRRAEKRQAWRVWLPGTCRMAEH